MSASDPIAAAKEKWIEHGWPVPDLMAAFTSILRVQRILNSMADRALRQLDLTGTRFEALYLLYFAEDGMLSLTEMSQKLEFHPTSITNIVDRLENQDLVRRVRDEADRRLVFCEILPAGRRVVEKATQIVADEIYSKAPWSKAEVAQFYDLLARLRRNLGDPV